MHYRFIFLIVFFFSFLLLPILNLAQAGPVPLPSNPSTIAKAQCESPTSSGGEGGTCVARHPTSNVTGCTAPDTFAGFCDNNSWGCCVTVEITDSPEQCNANGGTCAPGNARNCQLTTEDLIGTCDAAGTACCKPKEGPDLECKKLNGTCEPKAANCANKGSKIGACSTTNIGIEMICCSASSQSSGTTVGKLNYTLLEEIPGQAGTSGDLGSYLERLYNFTFWAIGVAALFMLTVGGFMYVTAAGNTSRISTAKTIITDSLLGIVVALFAWLFLYVINPDLTEGLALPSAVSTGSGGGGGSGSGTEAPVPADAKAAAQAILAGGTGITLSGSGSCATSNGIAVSPQYTLEQVANGQSATRCMNGCPTKGACTQTTSLNSQMLVGMIEVARKYPFTVTSITGGSHCEAGVSGCKGLSSHYTGNAIDISTSNKGDWPAIVSAFRAAGSNHDQTFCDYNGKQLPADRCNEANHIHIAF